MKDSLINIYTAVEKSSHKRREKILGFFFAPENRTKRALQTSYSLGKKPLKLFHSSFTQKSTNKTLCNAKKYYRWEDITLHLKIKKLSINSLRDFNMYCWIDLTKYFCPITSSLSATYDSFKSKVSKVVESKNGHHFY